MSEMSVDRRKYKRESASRSASGSSSGPTPSELTRKTPGQLFVDRRRYARSLASRLLRMDEVVSICGLSKASIYKNIKLGTFPSPIKIGLRASAWLKPEVDAWIERQISASRRCT